MPSGGARSRSGPPPDPNALRRDRKSDAAGWVTLPEEGRKGRVPKCPSVAPTKTELDLWAEVWKLPQAVEWERLRLHREVALYCRAYDQAMNGVEVKAADRTLVRQLADSLGLNTAGMARNRWRIGTPEPVAVDDGAEPGFTPARERFTVVDGAA